MYYRQWILEWIDLYFFTPGGVHCDAHGLMHVGRHGDDDDGHGGSIGGHHSEAWTPEPSSISSCGLHGQRPEAVSWKQKKKKKKKIWLWPSSSLSVQLLLSASWCLPPVNFAQTSSSSSSS